MKKACGVNCCTKGAEQPDTKQPLRSNRAQLDEMFAIGVASRSADGAAGVYEFMT
jgi:hypothetical protein